MRIFYLEKKLFFLLHPLTLHICTRPRHTVPVLTIIFFGWSGSAEILLSRHRQVEHVVVRRNCEPGHHLWLLKQAAVFCWRHTDF